MLVHTLSQKEKVGHLLALFTTIVWGTTYISTAKLLVDFSPVEILFGRIILAIVALAIAKPQRLKVQSKKHELYFAGTGLFGVTLYFMLQNSAMTYTYSANASVIISTAPFFVAIAMRVFCGVKGLTKQFFIGFLAAIIGIGLLSFSGQTLKLNPLGDVLCILAAMSWAGYNVFLRKLEPYGYDTLLVTRRIFVYGILFLLPALPFMNFSFDMAKFIQPGNLFNFLYLGVCASALCFVTWNVAIDRLGAIKTSVYIYLSPVITIIAAWLMLSDPVLPMALVGSALTLVGLVISQRGSHAAADGAQPLAAQTE
ncbi:MAG: DMT family transporter [Clostridiales bacterium]|nr:DMT family transporter [Clostridiales bacterium]